MTRSLPSSSSWLSTPPKPSVLAASVFTMNGRSYRGVARTGSVVMAVMRALTVDWQWSDCDSRATSTPSF
eukprot:1861690-Prymnesium_polylepis.1